MLSWTVCRIVSYKYAETKQTLTEPPYVAAPPPMGYPAVMNDSPQTVQQSPQTQSKGSVRLQCCPAAFWTVSSSLGISFVF
ncbi:unnamed protein product [Thlaspi arvense]|uniref:Uncharacterized protein n=1 Tax=Thlaspi arvense TaxID=13288 RepID=A0AAU9R3Z7_THLAR|nr:unnamed protein product [Thlaspi arvense]